MRHGHEMSLSSLSLKASTPPLFHVHGLGNLYLLRLLIVLN